MNPLDRLRDSEPTSQVVSAIYEIRMRVAKFRKYLEELSGGGDDFWLSCRFRDVGVTVSVPEIGILRGGSPHDVALVRIFESHPTLEPILGALGGPSTTNADRLNMIRICNSYAELRYSVMRYRSIVTKAAAESAAASTAENLSYWKFVDRRFIGEVGPILMNLELGTVAVEPEVPIDGSLSYIFGVLHVMKDGRWCQVSSTGNLGGLFRPIF